MVSHVLLGDWQQWLPNVIITLIFAWMVYILLNIVLNFREENLRVTRMSGATQSDEDDVTGRVALSKERLAASGNMLWEGAEQGEPSEFGGQLEEIGALDAVRDVDEGLKGQRFVEGHSDTTYNADEGTAKGRDNLTANEERVENIPEGPSFKLLSSASQASVGGIGEEPGAVTRPAAIESHDKEEASSKPADAVVGTDSEASHVPPLNKPQMTEPILPVESASQLVEGQETAAAKKANVMESERDEDEDEWEGVETSDLEDMFNAAATLVTTLALGQGAKFTQDMQLRLYGLYKQATEGPCEVPQPSIFNPKARAKWDAWKKQKDMKQEDAMEKYIEVVEEVCPGWMETAASAQQGSGSHGQKEEAAGEGKSERGGMGPVFSTMAEDESGPTTQERGLQGLQACASEGDVDALKRLLAQGAAINAADEEGRTALHWASDRGHLEAVRLLLNQGAAVDGPDDEGQTALHYAAVCEHEELAQVLLKHGADPQAKDHEGITCASLWPSTWQRPASS